MYSEYSPARIISVHKSSADHNTPGKYTALQYFAAVVFFGHITRYPAKSHTFGHAL